MNDRSAFERFLADQFAEAEWVAPPARSVDDILIAARRTRPVPRWLATLKEPPMRISSRVAVGSPTGRITAIVVILLMLSLLTAGGAVVGAALLTSPMPAGACPAGGGTFEASPPVPHAPMGGRVVTLSDGRMLIVGELDAQEQPVVSAALWDPATGAIRAAGTVAMADGVGGAMTLGDDRVLVVPFRSDAPAVVWDPSTESFTPTGTMRHLRGDFTTTRVPDDRVLVVGGDVRGYFQDAPIVDAEVWDPATSEFGGTGTPVHPRRNHSATLLRDGRVLLIGGADEAGAAIATAETWDPATGSFAEAGDMHAPSVSHQAVPLPDGTVLVIGGMDSFPGRATADAELWEPATGGFVPAGTMTTAREQSHSATLLPDGRVLVIGGSSGADAEGDRIPIGTAEVWDPVTRTFSPAGSLLVPRLGHIALLRSDCSVLVVGGSDPALGPTVERWVPGKQPG